MYLVKSIEEKGKGVRIVQSTTTTLRTPPTHRTFVQQMTLPKVVLKYYKQWQREGNENSRQTILPSNQGYPYGSPHHNIFVLIIFPLSLCITLHLVHSN